MHNSYDFLSNFAATGDSLAYRSMSGYDEKYVADIPQLSARGMLTGTATRVLRGNAGVQPYKYGTKELDRQNGLDLYDFEARQQDPMLGRFTTIDPMSEKYYSISPYAYCAGNPVLYGDPSGMKWNNLNDSLQMNIMLDARLLALKTSIHVLKRGRHESELSEAEAREISELQSQKQSVETSKQNLKDLGDDNKNFYELNYVTGDEIVAHNQLVNGIVQISTGHDLVLGVHEMDHIARYLKDSGLYFDDRGYLVPSKYYLNSRRYQKDELLAYRAQFAYSKQGFPIPGVVKMTDITPEKIAGLKNGFGQPLYPELLKQKMNIIK